MSRATPRLRFRILEELPGTYFERIAHVLGRIDPDALESPLDSEEQSPTSIVMRTATSFCVSSSSLRRSSNARLVTKCVAPGRTAVLSVRSEVHEPLQLLVLLRKSETTGGRAALDLNQR